MKVGIAIDEWKLAIFDRRLTQAGYAYSNAGRLTADTLLLKIETDNPIALEQVIRAAQAEAAQERSHGNSNANAQK